MNNNNNNNNNNRHLLWYMLMKSEDTETLTSNRRELTTETYLAGLSLKLPQSPLNFFEL